MGIHRVLLEIDLRHGFYSSGTCRGLRFAPTLATQALLARSGGALRATERGFVLLLDDEGEKAWEGADDEDALVWLVMFDDTALANFTAFLGRPRQELLYFDANDAVFDTPTGYSRLHALHAASTLELRSLPQAAADARLALTELRGNPGALIRIPLQALRSHGSDPTRYVIRMTPRETVWKYCFIGDWPEPLLQVVDLAQQMTFEPAPTHSLADGRDALVFLSNGPIALQEWPRERFQLRSRAGVAGADGRARPERIIVKRLPAAAPRHFSREVIDRVPALVSEIFVHR